DREKTRQEEGHAECASDPEAWRHGRRQQALQFVGPGEECRDKQRTGQKDLQEGISRAIAAIRQGYHKECTGKNCVADGQPRPVWPLQKAKPRVEVEVEGCEGAHQQEDWQNQAARGPEGSANAMPNGVLPLERNRTLPSRVCRSPQPIETSVIDP